MGEEYKKAACDPSGRRFHGRKTLSTWPAQDGPLRISEFEARGLGYIQQNAVNKPLPSTFNRFDDYVPFQGACTF